MHTVEDKTQAHTLSPPGGSGLIDVVLRESITSMNSHHTQRKREREEIYLMMENDEGHLFSFSLKLFLQWVLCSVWQADGLRCVLCACTHTHTHTHTYVKRASRSFYMRLGVKTDLSHCCWSRCWLQPRPRQGLCVCVSVSVYVYVCKRDFQTR